MERKYAMILQPSIVVYDYYEAVARRFLNNEVGDFVRS